MSEIRGGQIWAQGGGSCLTRYVTQMVDCFALLSDPRGEGSTVCTDSGGGWKWSEKSLSAHFEKFGYECKGQLSDILSEEAWQAL